MLSSNAHKNLLDNVGQRGIRSPYKGVCKGNPRQWRGQSRADKKRREPEQACQLSAMAGEEGNWDDSRNKLKAVPMHHSLNSRNSTFLFLCLPRVWIYLAVLCTFQSTVFIESRFCAEDCTNCYDRYKDGYDETPQPSDTYNLVRLNYKASNNNKDHIKHTTCFFHLLISVNA